MIGLSEIGEIGLSIMNTEIVGTSAVENALAKTDLLVTDIHKNDKLPSWDGDVYVYKHASKKKDCVAKVPVQVKGIKDNRAISNTMYFPYKVDIDDIKNYFNDGGVIYFVVKIGEDGYETIYYSMMLPANLDKIVKTDAKSKIIQFKKLPTDKNEIQGIFIDFIKHKELQSSVKQTGIHTDSDLHQAGYTKHFFNVRTKSPFDIVGKEVYMYAQNQIGAIACSGAYTIVDMRFDAATSTIKVEDKTYFVGAKFVQKVGQSKISFGRDNIVFTEKIVGNKRSLSLIVNAVGTLSESINICNFAIHLERVKQFVLNENVYDITGRDMDQKESIFAGNLIVLNKIKNLLDRFGIRKDILLLDSQSIDILARIAYSVLDNRPVSISNLNSDGMIRIKIADDILLFGSKKISDSSYVIENLFEQPVSPIHIRVSKDDIIIKEFDHSHFLLLYETDLYRILNMNLDFVHADVLSYISKEDDVSTADYAIRHYWFKLVKAFDATRNSIFMNKAKDMIAKIKGMSNLNEEFRDAIFLNDLQLIKRERILNKSEITEINKFILKTTISEQKVAGYLLIDDMYNAKLEFDKLNNNNKEMFKVYPMYKFWH